MLTELDLLQQKEERFWEISLNNAVTDFLAFEIMENNKNLTFMTMNTFCLIICLDCGPMTYFKNIMIGAGI